MTRRFLDLADAGPDAIAAILADALDRKAARRGWPKGKPDADRPLADHVLAMLFEHNSTRTRVSFDLAIRQLGGSSVVLEAGTMQLGRGESVADTARVLSRYVDALMVRTDDHGKLEEMAAYASVPVINGLSDRSHPCQLLADLLTVIERGVALPGSRWLWLGDANNVLHSLIEAAGLMQFEVVASCPDGFAPTDPPPQVRLEPDPRAAVVGADVVVTDAWVSMGQADSAAKLAAMQPYQVNEALLAGAKPGAVFLHCLPAHRGEEATDAVLDGPQSAVWDEAENRLHAQKSLLLWAFGRLG